MTTKRTYEHAAEYPVKARVARLLWLVSIAMTLAALPCPALSDVSYTPASKAAMATIDIFGQIGPDDLKHFIAFSKMARAERGATYFIRLNSVGGSMETALSIGRTVRADRAWAAVPRDSECLSACVFVLAGATVRIVDGLVGIHRPYSAAFIQTTPDLQKENYDRLGAEVKEYLRAVNIPDELYDRMLRIPPDRVMVLSNDELQRYGLNENDPYDEAARIASHAASIGISVEEYIQRQVAADQICSQSRDFAECYVRYVATGK